MRRGLALGAFAAAALGCADTARFSNEPGESWCGTVASASFVRAGIPEGTKLRLVLDADRLQTAPGQLWTGAFTNGEKFTAARLEVIPQLLHDPLSTLSFGEGRVKNALAVAELGATQVFVVLSLLQSGEVEVRILRGAGTSTSTPIQPPQLFGVFRLAREKGDCGLN